jgi:enediyne biosynthesis protein E4
LGKGLGRASRPFIPFTVTVLLGMRSTLFNLLLLFALSSCQKNDDRLFVQVPSHVTGITFENTIQETDKLNIMSYEYLYNGGGTAVGDFNNDGLPDLFFTGNTVPDKLYLNRGAWRFEDVSAKAGLGTSSGWKTGVTVADINADGLLDIYVCRSGPGSDEDRANRLFINNGGDLPTFTEKAADFGLEAKGTYSTQASFFDYDRDGDLDMFLLNHAKITYSPFHNTSRLRNLRHPRYGNRLYRNDRGYFHDVSAEAGIHGSGINFGLGVSVSDVNSDGWPDIYVTNDYEEQDFFYLNTRDGKFRECLKESFRHISRFGMGSDAADFNNDGMPDVTVVDMLPQDHYRQKLLKGPDEYDKYMLLRDSGYHHQNMRNMLQLNLGNNASLAPQFSEVGQLAGVAATDWSWCPLFVDLDNDGWKDLFITNGYLRDYTNLDFLKYTFEDAKKDAAANGKAFDTMALIRQMPSTNLKNFCFRNSRELRFENVSTQWGFSDAAISNSAVYADLDNDGDQDVVVNNINQKPSVYRNNTKTDANHFVKIRLSALGTNRFAVGAKVFVRTDSINQMQENFPTRGFQSCVSNELLFGLGAEKSIQEIVVHWPNGNISSVKNAHADTTYHLKQPQVQIRHVAEHNGGAAKLFTASSITGLAFKHTENDFVDFKREYLLPYRTSSNGPCIATADVNRDGFDDVFFGGAKGQAGRLLLSKKDRGYITAPSQPWQVDAGCEDTAAAFVDIDNDGDHDLIVVSGGSEFSSDESTFLSDRLYINSGGGVFEKLPNVFPRERSNGSCVAYSDYDHDGDVDLFFGGRSLPGYFPLPAYSHLFRNDTQGGKVKFTDITPSHLRKPGMVNSAVWFDYDDDGWDDLVVAGEFTSILAYKNAKGQLMEEKNAVFPKLFGLWSKIVASDIDMDGDTDLVAGNLGLNIQFTASVDEPLTLYYNDFNEDGRIDPILCSYIKGVQGVYPSRDEMLEQLPHLKKKFVKYDQYAMASLTDILSPEEFKRAKSLKADHLESVIFVNSGKKSFSVSPMPIEAQVSRISDIVVEDFDGDELKDILIAGNYYPMRVQLGRMDAACGLLLKQSSRGTFEPASFRQTGFFASGDVRSMSTLNSPAGPAILLGVNDDSIRMYHISKIRPQYP